MRNLGVARLSYGIMLCTPHVTMNAINGGPRAELVGK